MKIVYLSAPDLFNVPEADNIGGREHGYQLATLGEPLRRKNLQLVPHAWTNTAAIDWANIAGVVIGTCWDYYDYHEDFVAALSEIEAKNIPLFNPLSLVIWNSRKTYLRDLEAKGVRTIPTLWLKKPDNQRLEEAFQELEADRLVIKRQIGAGAANQLLFDRTSIPQSYPFDSMVQPFMPLIQTEGEFSFIFIDGQFCHALLKIAKSGDYRIQGHFGGREVRYEPSAQELATAHSVLETLPEMPLYARVDMLRGDDGELLLMEVELIEPYLYPEQSDRLGDMFADALSLRLPTHRS